MITLPKWQHKTVKIENFSTESRGYEKDKYKLLDMAVGDSIFHAMIPNNRISPYTSAIHRTTKRRYLVLKHRHEDIDGTLVVRLTDKGVSHV